MGLFSISPWFRSDELLKAVDAHCDDALKMLKPRVGDEYELPVDLVKPKRFEHFTEAHERMLGHDFYRLLSLSELLFVNLRKCNPLLKFEGSPIIACDFALDFEPEATGNTEEDRHLWILRPICAYHGSVLGSDARFAVTPKTDVDRGEFSQRFLEKHMKKLRKLQNLPVQE